MGADKTESGAFSASSQCGPSTGETADPRADPCQRTWLAQDQLRGPRPIFCKLRSKYLRNTSLDLASRVKCLFDHTSHDSLSASRLCKTCQDWTHRHLREAWQSLSSCHRLQATRLLRALADDLKVNRQTGARVRLAIDRSVIIFSRTEGI